jgi:hypothetical protein
VVTPFLTGCCSALVRINHKGVDARESICYKYDTQTNGAHLKKKKTRRSKEKRLTAGYGSVIKFDFAGQLFATE